MLGRVAVQSAIWQIYYKYPEMLLSHIRILIIFIDLAIR